MDAAAIQARLVIEFAALSGIAENHVYVGDQNGIKLPAPRIVLDFCEIDQYGVRAEEAVSDHPSPSPGAEIVITRAQLSFLSVDVECFTSTLTGNAAAWVLLSTLRLGITRRDVRRRLKAAGVTVMKLGRVLNVTSSMDEPLESHATLRIEFQTIVTDSKSETYIEHVVVRQEGIAGSVTIDVVEGS